MTRDASVVRDAAGLNRLAEALASASVRRISARADVEDAALTLTARAVAAAAAERNESRGCHHRGDHPDAEPALAASTVVRLDVDERPVVQVPAGVHC